MSKIKDKPVEKPRRADAARHQASESSTENPSAWSRTVRETIESVVIAFVLAFLFRTFEAEAFVIPTGSMAPTLMGRHMDLKCPKCGYRFQIGGPDDERTPQETRQEAVCPLCRFAIEPTKDSQYYNGDRILVSKFAFDFVEPKRWDVIVFKFPDDAKTNYIKRLIGLPGEVIRIRDGDIQFSRDGGKTFEMARKDPAKMRAMLQIVYDNDYVYEPFLAKGWPARWQGDPSWTNELRDGKPDYQAFVSDGKSPGGTSGIAWMRYYNYVPDRSDWSDFENGRPLNSHPRAEPIRDSIAYDESGGASGANEVSDLAVDCEVNVPAATGTIVLELVKKGRRFGCQLDLATGSAQMLFPGIKPEAQPRATEGGISRAGTYRLLFANIDHELTLLVDSKPVQFDKPTTYAELTGDRETNQQPDSSPVGIGVSGAAVKVSHLRVWRDVYYTYDDSRRTLSHPRYASLSDVPPRWPEANDWACTPAAAASRLRDAGADVQPRDQYFFVGKHDDGRSPARDGVAIEDQYFPLGDNSPSSQDGRYWGNRHFVDRRLLVGKALYIYWPHSFDKIRFSDSFSIPFPFFPNFARMGFVR